MNIPLLRMLREAEGAYLPLSGLGNDLESVDRDLRELQQFGFGLEIHPYFGAAYRFPSARLCPDLIEHGLETRHIGRRIAVWDRVASTNDLAARASGSAANAGLVVLAEEQTAGRGRRGRHWTAPYASSILLSTLLFPEGTLADPAWLTALAAVATCEVVETWSGRTAQVKWPNDVRLHKRKVAGILVERAQGAVIGIGLNVNGTALDFPESLRSTATSIRIESGESVDRSEVARSLILRLEHWWTLGACGDTEQIHREWRRRSEHPGQAVGIETPGGIRTGVVCDLDLKRGLSIRDTSGLESWIPPAEILAVRDGENGIAAELGELQALSPEPGTDPR